MCQVVRRGKPTHRLQKGAQIGRECAQTQQVRADGAAGCGAGAVVAVKGEVGLVEFAQVLAVLHKEQAADLHIFLGVGPASITQQEAGGLTGEVQFAVEIENGWRHIDRFACGRQCCGLRR